MANIGAVITSIRNIMRQDRGISGDAQRLEQLGWMLFLKIIDDKDQELRERCPGHDVPPSYPDGMTEEQRLEVSERQEEIHQCVNTILEEFAKKDNENRRIYESKIESVLESLYDENQDFKWKIESVLFSLYL